MKSKRLGVLVSGFTLSALMAGALPPGSPAPDFKGVDSNGVTHSLSEYRGKFVVLEWANQGCPYEQKHYLSGNMESLQKQWTGKGVVWLSIISSAPGEQGYVTPAQENDYLKTMKASPTAALLDPQGTIGHLYDAKTTPHMFVIDPAGVLAYRGAIDNSPDGEGESPTGGKLVNYVDQALDDLAAKRPVAVAETKAYGCGVKYR